MKRPSHNDVKRALGEAFSRDVMGSVLLGVASGKVVEKIITLLAPDTATRLVAWTIAFVVFLFAYSYWCYLRYVVSETIDTVDEEVDEFTDEVDEFTDEIDEFTNEESDGE